MGMIGFKAFDKNLKCRDFQYEIGHTYEFDSKPIPCERGFHFCKSIAATYNYYDMNKNTRICKIEALGDVSTDDDIKYCTNKIKILEEITEDWVRKGNADNSSLGYCNTGSFNTGNRNAGHNNIGNRNTGNNNTGNRNAGNNNTCGYNTGSYNTGSHNTGSYNAGNCNTGHNNTGDYNTGNCNTGYDNAGDYNTGSGNTGDYNTGNCNTGHGNTGDWNTTNNSSGCFNTEKEYIFMFNKPTEWTFEQWSASDACYILRHIPKNVIVYVHEKDMTDEEKEMHPTYKTTGGYLKVLNKENVTQKYWDKLSEEDKQKIYDLPNFDKDIFKQCTGIEV